MEVDYHHRILVVDDDEAIGKAIGRILQTKKIDYVFVNSAESALEKIKNTKKPFSCMIKYAVWI